MEAPRFTWPPSSDPVGQLESERSFGWEPCGRLIRSEWEEAGDFQCRADWDSSALRINIAMEKPLQWDPEKGGWRWHKTWRLPEIGIRILSNTAQPFAWEVRIHVVCGGAIPNELEDVGVSVGEGPPAIVSAQIVDGTCRFSRLRLQGTSNTRGGRRFHIVLSLLRRDPTPGSEAIVAASFISSGFHVFSRKDADKKTRKSSTSERPSHNGPSGSFHVVAPSDPLPLEFEPFSPELFEKKFVKKVSDHNGHTIEDAIDNSAQGLANYFQAPNIRHKSRHPIFLAVRFSQVLCLMRDVSAFLVPNEKALRALFCACGIPPNCQLPDCPSCLLRRGIKSYDGGELAGMWYMSFRPEMDCPLPLRQWLAEHLRFVKTKALLFISEISPLPPKFASTDVIDDIVRLYRRVYLLEIASGAEVETVMQTEGIHTGDISPETSPAIAPYEGHDQDYDHSDRFMDTKAPSMQVDTTGELDVSSEPVKAAFAEFFVGLHSEIRVLLARFTEAASEIVASPSPDSLRNLQDAYYHFTEVLAVHTYVEDTILFPELARRVPGVTEAYNFDHYKESDHLTRIYGAIGSLEAENAAELFLGISGFAAIHSEHLEKEEEHLLPYMLTVFSDEEMVQLMQACADAARARREERNQSISG
eukprot:CAMPEP_0184688546 /NCGR_PEP_ID=MMETSP0312-20130426/30158_1 /TAXON_ID=31354 /ORGANISM="Compsopogon coeruleus, Strain SAG 36.94" /LENGTH=643 /DNA_ID=CAMNT_0027145795 /DNA_START=388 /DNA_END=2319 /DNA_ORIENTATION=-